VNRPLFAIPTTQALIAVERSPSLHVALQHAQTGSSPANQHRQKIVEQSDFARSADEVLKRSVDS
jgi:hypothetical protein